MKHRETEITMRLKHHEKEYNAVSRLTRAVDAPPKVPGRPVP
jgi:hypothetical protein